MHPFVRPALRTPWHPVLFAAWPVLALYAANRHELFPDVLVVPLLAVLLFTLCAWGAFGLLLRSLDKGALLASAAVVLLFSFAHVRARVMHWDVGDPFLRHDLFNLAWLQLFLVACLVVLRSRGDRARAHRVATIVAAALVAVPTATIAAFEIGERDGWVPTASAASASVGASAADLPNVYYLVVDGHAHPQTLRDLYGYDASPFVGALEQEGFYVVPESRSNYALTFLSLSSTMDMRYHEGLPRDSLDREVPHRMIADSELVRALRAHGYRYVHLTSGWSPTTDVRTADLKVDCAYMNEFQRVLLSTTPALLFPEATVGNDRDRARCPFERLPEFARQDGPLFVFAHVLLPHWPFVFDAQGGRVDPSHEAQDGIIDNNDTEAFEAKRRMYADQARYTDRLILEMVREILRNEDRPPVIVVHSDHGPDLLGVTDSVWADPSDDFKRERLRNFEAVHLPGGPGGLYPTMTAVNLWRVVLDETLGTDYGTLDDRSFYSGHPAPYAFEDVTDVVDFR